MPQRDPAVYLEDIEYYACAPGIAEKISHSRDIVGFRNILAHGYAELDHRKVYDVAVKHAPALLAAVKSALGAFPEPTEPSGGAGA